MLPDACFGAAVIKATGCVRKRLATGDSLF